MPRDVVMPQMGESIFEGTITKWLKKAGDVVAKDEPLFEISTDKVDAEIPSPVAGVLSEIKIEAGTTVGVNTVVAVVIEDGQTAESARDGGMAGSSPVPARAAAPEVSETAVKLDASTVTGSGETEIVMPQMGESIFEGTITKWLKKPGDAVEKDEPLFEISTDKVDAEIPSPAAGTLSAIKVAEGETVAVNTVVAVIGSPGGIATSSTEPVSMPRVGEIGVTAKAPDAPEVVNEHTGSERLRSSPLVRRMARENNLDLRDVEGTGSAGRITKEDIVQYLREHGSGTKRGADETKTVLRAGASPSARIGKPASMNQAPDLVEKTVALSRMRGIIADRMVESAATSPHVYVVYKIDMTRVVRQREREKDRFEQQHGVKLTYMPFIAAAAIEALRMHPVVNASLTKEQGQAGSIEYHAHVNLGIAVALEWGLIVPVVKQAEAMSFADIARSMADLAERARGKKLKPEEASGSTFTLTNFGVFGGEFGTPIINQPESAILAIGGLKKEAVVLSDGEGNDTIAIRSMQSNCLGFDHRLIDGADAGKFMSTFKGVLEGWDREIG